MNSLKAVKIRRGHNRSLFVLVFVYVPENNQSEVVLKSSLTKIYEADEDEDPIPHFNQPSSRRIAKGGCRAIPRLLARPVIRVKRQIMIIATGRLSELIS